MKFHVEFHQFLHIFQKMFIFLEKNCYSMGYFFVFNEFLFLDMIINWILITYLSVYIYIILMNYSHHLANYEALAYFTVQAVVNDCGRETSSNAFLLINFLPGQSTK